jgi:hypothetical protein
MRKSLKKQILRGAQDDKDYVSNFGDRTLVGFAGGSQDPEKFI